MKRPALIFVGLGVLALVLSFGADTANAQRGFDGCGYGGYFGGGYSALNGGVGNFLPYSLGRVPVPPYFALHPPVYYSQPVARPYGHSPFAYPGTMQTPEVAEPVAADIMNPYVPASQIPEEMEAPQGSSEGRIAKSEMIVNPFVSHEVPNAVEVARIPND